MMKGLTKPSGSKTFMTLFKTLLLVIMHIILKTLNDVAGTTNMSSVIFLCKQLSVVGTVIGGSLAHSDKNNSATC